MQGRISGVLPCFPTRLKRGVYIFIRGIKERVTIYSQMKRRGTESFINPIKNGNQKHLYFVADRCIISWYK